MQFAMSCITLWKSYTLVFSLPFAHKIGADFVARAPFACRFVSVFAFVVF
jgi:hypothetical protein